MDIQCGPFQSKSPRHLSRLLHGAALTNVLLVLTQITAPPAAKALGFTAGTKTTSPFFFDGQSASSSWTLNSNGSAVSNWGYSDSPACVPDNGLCVVLNSANSVTIHGGGNANQVTTWVSLNGSVGNAQGYYVSFSGTFTPGPNQNSDAVATFSYGNTTSSPLGASFTVDTFWLKSNETLSFRISNGLQSYGDLRINNFSYSPVPSPLPATGAAAAFGYSRRLRRRIKGISGSASRPQSRTPAHPAAYLNLAPAALQSLPLSFHYSSPETPSRTPHSRHSHLPVSRLPASSPAAVCAQRNA